MQQLAAPGQRRPHDLWLDVNGAGAEAQDARVESPEHAGKWAQRQQQQQQQQRDEEGLLRPQPPPERRVSSKLLAVPPGTAAMVSPPSQPPSTQHQLQGQGPARRVTRSGSEDKGKAQRPTSARRRLSRQHSMPLGEPAFDMGWNGGDTYLSPSPSPNGLGSPPSRGVQFSPPSLCSAEVDNGNRSNILDLRTGERKPYSRGGLGSPYNGRSPKPGRHRRSHSSSITSLGEDIENREANMQFGRPEPKVRGMSAGMSADLWHEEANGRTKSSSHHRVSRVRNVAPRANASSLLQLPADLLGEAQSPPAPQAPARARPQHHRRPSERRRTTAALPVMRPGLDSPTLSPANSSASMTSPRRSPRSHHRASSFSRRNFRYEGLTSPSEGQGQGATTANPPDDQARGLTRCYSAYAGRPRYRSETEVPYFDEFLGGPRPPAALRPNPLADSFVLGGKAVPAPDGRAPGALEEAEEEAADAFDMPGLRALVTAPPPPPQQDELVHRFAVWDRVSRRSEADEAPEVDGDDDDDEADEADADAATPEMDGDVECASTRRGGRFYRCPAPPDDDDDDDDNADLEEADCVSQLSPSSRTSGSTSGTSGSRRPQLRLRAYSSSSVTRRGTETEQKLCDSRDSNNSDAASTNSSSARSSRSSSVTQRAKSPRSGKNIVDNRTINWSRGKLIGRGTYGEVYLALDCDNGQQFAVKKITKAAGDASRAAKIQDEINVMRKLSHDNIVRYIGSQTDTEGVLFIFLEFVTGGSLAHLIKEHGPLSTSLVAKFSKHITLGVDYLHSANIIHRDIKGANVLITDNGVAKLADFGCSKQLELLDTQDRDNTLRNIRGSIPWMAPEMIKQSGHDKATDIWSLGCTVLEMATGKSPWPKLRDHVNALFVIGNTDKPPPIPRSFRGTLLRDFMLRCFVIDPEARALSSELLEHPFVEASS